MRKINTHLQSKLHPADTSGNNGSRVTPGKTRRHGSETKGMFEWPAENNKPHVVEINITYLQVYHRQKHQQCLNLSVLHLGRTLKLSGG